MTDAELLKQLQERADEITLHADVIFVREKVDGTAQTVALSALSPALALQHGFRLLLRHLEPPPTLTGIPLTPVQSAEQRLTVAMAGLLRARDEADRAGVALRGVLRREAAPEMFPDKPDEVGQV